MQTITAKRIATIKNTNPDNVIFYQVWVWRTGWRKMWHCAERRSYHDENYAILRANEMAKKHRTMAKVVRIEL